MKGSSLDLLSDDYAPAQCAACAMRKLRRCCMLWKTLFSILCVRSYPIMRGTYPCTGTRACKVTLLGRKTSLFEELKGDCTTCASPRPLLYFF